jgi:hypothetical protein
VGESVRLYFHTRRPRALLLASACLFLHARDPESRIITWLSVNYEVSRKRFGGFVYISEGVGRDITSARDEVGHGVCYAAGDIEGSGRRYDRPLRCLAKPQRVKSASCTFEVGASVRC